MIICLINSDIKRVLKNMDYTRMITSGSLYHVQHKYSQITCPKCGKETTFLPLIDAIDDSGEIYMCNHCKWPFHYCL